MPSKPVVLEHENMFIKFVETPNGLWQASFNPEKVYQEPVEVIPTPNFQLMVAGKPHPFNAALLSGATDLPLEMKMVNHEVGIERWLFTYQLDDPKLSVTVEMRLIQGAAVLRQFTSIKNEDREPVVLTQVSSMCINGIATDGCRPWHDPQKIQVYYCLQTWQGEGQWRSGDLEGLGLFPNSVHPCTAAIHFSSVGSWSTGRFLPMAVLEDRETGKVWYFQIETSSNWHFEIGRRGSWTEPKGALFINADGANERFGGWTKKLAPGEVFSTVPVAVGCCRGDFADAVKELTKYRRSVLKPKPAWPGDCPLIFNDYMNCLWGDPKTETLRPLIDTASELGADYFCIDAGWFTTLDTIWGYGLGDWEPSPDRFGPEGLLGMINYIRSKGMVPGLWLEMEVCGANSAVGRWPDSWFIRRNGSRVGGGARWFLNFTNAEVRQYAHEVIDRLVQMGVGYFKNDYNDCIGNGDDQIGSSSPDGLILQMRAFYEFIDEVRARHPGLILENCASGAMREDYGILSHFHLQSSSDQEIYHHYPSIIGGSLAGVLPEQLGIWVYPYPLLYLDRKNPESLSDPQYLAKMADGEETIFNMVNGLCGNLYLSGHPEIADELNRSLIIEGVALYKKERPHLHNSFPIWPLGFTRLNDKNTWASAGLVNEDNSRVLLAVWRLESALPYQELPLAKWSGKKAAVRQIYPAKNFGVDFHYNEIRGSLTVHLPKNYQARYFEIKEV